MVRTAREGPVAVVPLKALGQAKSRLADRLDGAGRRELASWLLARVVGACAAAQEVADVLVVAGDPAAAAVARHLGVETILEAQPGLQAAIRTADRATAGWAATLVVAADLPLATAADLDAVCRAGCGAGVVVAPTADGGTAALLRRPTGVIATAYGPGSAAAHLTAARAGGVNAVRLDVAGLSLDVDTAEDLRLAESCDDELARFLAGLSAAR